MQHCVTGLPTLQAPFPRQVAGTVAAPDNERGCAIVYYLKGKSRCRDERERSLQVLDLPGKLAPQLLRSAFLSEYVVKKLLRLGRRTGSTKPANHSDINWFSRQDNWRLHRRGALDAYC